MTNFWEGCSDGKAKHLRLLTREDNWLAWHDEDADQSDPAAKRVPGCHTRVEETLLSTLHSTNVIVLLGSGASFSAKNETGVGAPSMRSLWEAVKLEYGEKKFNFIVNKVLGPISTADEENIESLLSLCKMSTELLEVRANKNSDVTDTDWLKKLKDFITAAEEAILKVVGFVDASTKLPAHKTFLQKFASRSPEKPRVKLFTTNYDLCIEMAARSSGIALIDGFSHSAEQIFNRDYFHHDIVRRSANGTKSDYLDGVFQLYKLHGSVDWRRRLDGVVIRSLQEPSPELRPVLIYPRSSKYQEAFESPYLDMFAALQASLREPDTTLIVAGFGFNDDHISAPIWSALESNLSLRLILCDRAFVPEHKLFGDNHEIKNDASVRNKVQKDIFGLVEGGDRRIMVLNGRFEDLVDAMPAVSGSSDRQRLSERLDSIRENASG